MKAEPDATADAEPPGGWRTADFDFELPPEAIAHRPADRRSGSRLLDATRRPAVDRRFADLAGLLAPGDLLVLNDTRVVKARLAGRKATGGAVELLVERVVEPEAGGPAREMVVHLRASRSPQPGSRLLLGDGQWPAEVLGRDGEQGELFRLRLADSPWKLMAEHGAVPLPPYIDPAADASGEGATFDHAARYQTVFAREPGAVAAPTASLHFDEPLLAALQARGVEQATLTLHVGAGTFQPVRGEDLATHAMHAERYVVTPALVEAVAAARRRGGRIVAAGTTALRALESAALAAEGVDLSQPWGWREAAPPPVSPGLQAGSGATRLFIVPGYRFRVVDRLITNFHLPRSTLLMLVSAFAGTAPIRSLYQHAIATGYRFYSYGDAMLLPRQPARTPAATIP